MSLDIRRSSASVWGSHSGMRSSADGLEVHRHDDLHRLQGLRGRVPGVERPEARRHRAGRHVPDAADAARRVLEPDPLQRARLRRRHRLADAQGPVHALRRAGLPRGLPGPRRDRAVRERDRRRQSRPVHRLQVLRDGLPLRRAPVLADHREDGQVHALRRPRLRRPRAGVRQGLPDRAVSTSGPRTTC